MTDPKAPLYGYNKQYFILNPKYTQEELFELQTKILELITKGSEDLEKDLNSNMDDKTVRHMLMNCYRKGLVKKEFFVNKKNDGKIETTRRFYTKK